MCTVTEKSQICEANIQWAWTIVLGMNTTMHGYPVWLFCQDANLQCTCVSLALKFAKAELDSRGLPMSDNLIISYRDKPGFVHDQHRKTCSHAMLEFGNVMHARPCTHCMN